MERRIRAHAGRVLAAAAVAVWLMPLPAHADSLIVPFIGANFGGDAANCNGVSPCSTKQVSYGLGFGFMAGGIIGLEGEFSYSPSFFGEGSGRSDNHLYTVMANVLVGIPLGPVRPYAVGGFGVLHSDISESSIGLYQAFSNNSAAFDAGGGLLVIFTPHVGVRGDVRYVRTLQDLNFTAFQINSKALQFGRGSVGVVFRF